MCNIIYLREPVVAARDTIDDGGGLGADSVGDDPVLENPVVALETVTLAHGQLSPVFLPSLVMMKRLPSASSLSDQAPITSSGSWFVYFFLYFWLNQLFQVARAPSPLTSISSLLGDSSDVGLVSF
jgi:hypothetical protein